MEKIKVKPKIRYDPETDILYIHYRDGVSHEILEVCEDIVVEVDENGRIMGVEIWHASRMKELKELMIAIDKFKENIIANIKNCNPQP